MNLLNILIFLVDGSRPFFELMNPIIHSKDQAIVTESQDNSISPKQSTSFVQTADLLAERPPLRWTESTSSLKTSITTRLEAEFETLSSDNVMNIIQNSGKGILILDKY